MKPRENTPIEEYQPFTHTDIVYVKREDKAVDPPAPPFSKVRGLYSHLSCLYEAGVRVVGYTETAVSMAGWGVAWATQELGMTAVIFNPQYKTPMPLLRYHRKQWKKFSPQIIPIPAGRAKVGYYQSKKILEDQYGPEARMLELGLPLEETIVETAAEWRRTMEGVTAKPRTTVVNVGSGTICAGILRGWEQGDGIIVGVMGRNGNIHRKRKDIQKKSGRSLSGLTSLPFSLANPGWGYTERSNCECPFPCHPYYDLKAWEWLEKNIDGLKQPVLFWNIGRMAL